MRHNMKTFDRLLRTLLVAPAAVVIGILIGPGSAGAIVLYVVAAIMLATSAVGYCPLYSLLHLDGHNRTRLAR